MYRNWKINVPNFEPACQNFRYRSRVRKQEHRLVLAHVVADQPQPRGNLWMRVQLPSKPDILISRLRKNNLQPHHSRNRNTNDLNASTVSNKKLGNLLRTTDGRRKPYHLKVSANHCPKPFQRQTQLASTFAVSYFMYFINYQPLETLQMLPHYPARQNRLQRFRSCNQNVRWAPRLPCPLFRFRITMSYS